MRCVATLRFENSHLLRCHLRSFCTLCVQRFEGLVSLPLMTLNDWAKPEMTINDQCRESGEKEFFR